MGRRWIAVLAVVLAAVATGLPAAGQPAALALLVPHPLPGEVVAAGGLRLAVTVAGAALPLTVEVRLDDQPVAAEAGDPDTAGLPTVRADVHVAPGEHVAGVRVVDANGAVGERWWRFLASPRSLTRLAGDDRVATAVAIAAAVHPQANAAPAAVLARADGFADALAGAPLAHALGGPLLLARADGLPAATRAELLRALAPGARVHLLGGSAALGAAVEEAVAALGFTTVRHAGEDRFATAAAIAEALPPSDGAVVASATSFADALAASALAARDGLPILLTDRDALPTATVQALEGRATALVVGGPAVVGEDVVDALTSQLGLDVLRLSGDDRYATAAAIQAHGWPAGDGLVGVALASGESAADALAGVQHAAALGIPLLLTRPEDLPAATDAALRSGRPGAVTVYGGPAAASPAAAQAALRAAEDGPGVPRLLASVPAAAQAATTLDAVTLVFDRPVDPAASTVTLLVADRELPVRPVAGASPNDLRVDVTLPALGRPPLGSAARLVVAAAAPGAPLGHTELAFTYAVPDLVLGTTGPVVLHLPSAQVQLVGFHQSNHDGAQQQEPATAVPTVTMPSRGRGTPSRSSADVVAAPDGEVLAPVTGTVLRAGSYVLYCDHTDHYVVIEPDARPGWEVKVLHFVGLQVAAGDRVAAGRTVLGDHPRVLPFRSQVDDYSDPVWPHVHVEVVDPSIPDRPGEPC